MHISTHTKADGTKVIDIHLRVELPQGGQDFSQWEEMLADSLNEAGLAATSEAIKAMDTRGESLQAAGRKWTSKGEFSFVAETPYGPVPFKRHVYQTSAGGETRAPANERAALVGSATPRFAAMIASKLAEMTARSAVRDLALNHRRNFSNTAAQDIALLVSAQAQSRDTALEWEPAAPPEQVATIVVGVDGAMIHTRTNGWRQAMAGTLSLYDNKGERLDTLYIGCGPGTTPAEGKAVFFGQMDHHLDRLKARHPDAVTLGLSDAASDLLGWLQERTCEQLIDFHHAAEYLSGAAEAFEDGQDWAGAMRSLLRDEPGAAKALLADMTKRLDDCERSPLSASQREGLQKAVTYFTNHHERMDYAGWRERKRPIGSGVTEAACKTVIKERLTKSGMRWGLDPAHAILQLRALFRTPARWSLFWRDHQSRALANAL
jgi:hypothetical protein